MKIKAIVFDIGDVLIKENNLGIPEKVEEEFNLDKEKFKFLRKKYLNKSLIINDKDFWFEKNIAKELNLNLNDFVKYWQGLREKSFNFPEEAKKILGLLRRKNLILATLTDVNYSFDIIRQEIGIYDFFDFNFKSIELGIKKPSRKIFKIMLKKLNLSPEEVLFIDDLEINLKSPRELGMNVIHFKNYPQLKKDLNKLVGLKE